MPCVRIAIKDQGVGIPAKDLERIFERFYRVDPGRARETGGTGLGLSIVRHVAQNHGGTVLVESREGEGSTFTLELPAEPLWRRSAQREQRVSVLVVEDEESFVDALTIGLDREGFDVTVARDGQQAVDALRQGPLRHRPARSHAAQDVGSRRLSVDPRHERACPSSS